MSVTTKRLALALGAAVLVSIVFVFFSMRSGDPAPEGPDSDLVEVRDEEAGFSVKIPGHWDDLTEQSNDDLVRLLTGPRGTDDSVSVKVIVLPGEVVIDAQTPQEEINELQATFDQIVDQLPGLTEVLQRQRINVNGTQGWYYLYKFKDDEGTGIHFRYFLFEGDKEYILTFQVYPEDHFDRMAPVFDEILGTFNFKINQPTPEPSASASPSAAPSPAPSP